MKPLKEIQCSTIYNVNIAHPKFVMISVFSASIKLTKHFEENSGYRKNNGRQADRRRLPKSGRTTTRHERSARDCIHIYWTKSHVMIHTGLHYNTSENLNNPGVDVIHRTTTPLSRVNIFSRI